MFCLPRPHDHFETGTPRVVLGIAFVDAFLLLPLYLSNPHAFLFEYGFAPARATVLTFFSAIFLHVSILHYIGNMWFFWVFGKKIEATLGHMKFAFAFLLCGICGQFAYWITSLHSAVACVGASGAISGIAGMYLVLYPRDRFDLFLYFGWIRVKTIESNARVAVAAWIGEQLLLALITLVLPFSSTAFWAHVGGFLMGMAIASAYCRHVPVEARPNFTVTELPLADEIAQPNSLIGLDLTSPQVSRYHKDSTLP